MQFIVQMAYSWFYKVVQGNFCQLIQSFQRSVYTLVTNITQPISERKNPESGFI